MALRMSFFRSLLLASLAAVSAHSFADATVQWRAQWPNLGEGFTSGWHVQKDTSSNYLVVGTTATDAGEDIFVQKYDSSGTLVWSVVYDPPGETDACPYGFRVDGAGNAVITGCISDGSNPETWLTLKVTANGIIQWVRTAFEGASMGVAIDSAGQIFITGDVSTPNGADFVTRKISSNGAIVWTRTYNGPNNTDDLGQIIEVDDLGNIYAGGYSRGSTTGPAYVQRLIKYTPNGQKLWVKTLALVGVDVTPTKIVTKPGGGCYLASDASGQYGVLSSHGSDGNPIWRRTFNASAAGIDVLADFALATDGNLYAVANTENSSGYTDLLLRRYDSLGNLAWQKKFSSPSGGDDTAEAIAIADDGTLYIAGETCGCPTGDPTQTMVLKYTSAGSRIWSYFFSNGTDGYDVSAAAITDGNSAIVVGTTAPLVFQTDMSLFKIN